MIRFNLRPRTHGPPRRTELPVASEAQELRQLIRGNSQRVRVAVVAQPRATEWESCTDCCRHTWRRIHCYTHTHSRYCSRIHSRSHKDIRSHMDIRRSIRNKDNPNRDIRPSPTILENRNHQ
jgi:hypothetical protein